MSLTWASEQTWWWHSLTVALGPLLPYPPMANALRNLAIPSKAALSLCPGERTASACKALSQAGPAEPLAPWLLTHLPFQSALLQPVLLLSVLEVFRWIDELPKDSMGRGRL